MKELKNKKTGKTSLITDEEYATMVNKKEGNISLRYTVTDLRMRPIVPSLKQELPVEIKKIKSKT